LLLTCCGACTSSKCKASLPWNSSSRSLKYALYRLPGAPPVNPCNNRAWRCTAGAAWGPTSAVPRDKPGHLCRPPFLHTNVPGVAGHKKGVRGRLVRKRDSFARRVAQQAQGPCHGMPTPSSANAMGGTDQISSVQPCSHHHLHVPTRRRRVRCHALQRARAWRCQRRVMMSAHEVNSAAAHGASTVSEGHHGCSAADGFGHRGRVLEGSQAWRRFCC